MFHVLILVCAIGISPAECQTDTALDVIQGPSAANEVQCGLFGQAYVAESDLRRNDDEYVKVKCTRTTIGKGNVG